MEKKLTKKDFYAAIRAMVEGIEMVGDIPADEVLAFIDKTVEQLDAKAAKAKEKAAETKAKGDELREVVQAVLTEEYQTIDEITAQVEGEDITKSKVTARLTQLVKNEIAEKEQVKEEGTNRKVMAYRLKAAADAELEETEIETEE